MLNKSIKSGVLAVGFYVLFTANTLAQQQKVPEWTEETNVPKPSRYESFKNGLPENWKLQGQGSFSINPWHYKLGKQSLQWDYKAGDIIRINNTLGNTRWRGGRANACMAHFGVWIYNKEPMPGKNIRFEFREGEEEGAYFDFPLNFKGWQCAFPIYITTVQNNLHPVVGRKSFSRPVTFDVDNILVRAPEDTDGQVLIDALVYNGPMYSMINFLPNEKPWQPPELDESENPIPDKVSPRDMEAMEKVRDALVSQVLLESETEEGNRWYEHAQEKINYLNIVEDEHGIRGRPLNLPRWHGAEGGAIEFFVENGVPEEEIEWFNRAIIRGGAFGAIERSIRTGVTREQYDHLLEQGALIWKYLLDQGFNTSVGNGHYYTGTFTACITAAYLLRDILFEQGLMDDVLPYLQYYVYPFSAVRENWVSMDYMGSSKTLLYGTFLSGETPEKQLQILRFLGKKFSHEIISDFGSTGFKPDGVGEHCVGFSVDYMKNGLNGISEIAYLFSNSSFALSDEAYETLKRVAIRMYFYSCSLDVPLTMQGTGVFDRIREVFQLPWILRHLALAGKDGCDMELAQAYVNLKPLFETSKARGNYDPVFEEKYGLEPSNPTTGNISMPYGGLVAQRRSNWVAIAHSGADMRDRGNHYGYFLRNGPLTIMDRNGLAAAGTVKEGWDWNRIDGATAPYIPELTEITYMHSGRKIKPENAEGHEKAKQWFEKFKTTDAHRTGRHVGNGGISWRGINGSYRRVFANDALLNPYRGIKSYFFIDDRIYAIGSDITSYSRDYRIQTTLYQKALPAENSPTWINNEKVTGFPSTNHLPLTVNHSTYLIDSMGNGYFVPAGQNLYTARKTQESRLTKFKKHEDTVGNFATAWLDHGLECKNAEYVYVIMPYCNPDELMEFSENSYKILQQDGKAHILHDKIDGFFAGIFFEGGAVKNLPHVKNVERACHIMYKESNGTLEVAAGDPAPHRWKCDELGFGSYGGRSVLTPLKVTFAGAWEFEHPVDGVKIIGSNEEETVFEFACIHGKTFDFTLREIKSSWPGGILRQIPLWLIVLVAVWFGPLYIMRKIRGGK